VLCYMDPIIDIIIFVFIITKFSKLFCHIQQMQTYKEALHDDVRTVGLQ